MNVQKETSLLSEELDHVKKLTKVFTCEECGLACETRSNLKMHKKNNHEFVAWKTILLEIETENSRLKFKISLDLFRIKELELTAKESCRCRGFCAISYCKHNWTKSVSDEILLRMEK